MCRLDQVTLTVYNVPNRVKTTHDANKQDKEFEGNRIVNQPAKLQNGAK